MIKSAKNVVLLGLVLILAGCAVDRSTISIEVPEAVATTDDAVAVKIISVEDKRIFELRPSTPDIPSLSEDEINSPEIKARALARKRNAYGKALGDVILPTGQTVAGLVKKTLVNSLQDAGYKVVEQGDPAFLSAVPVKVQVIQFWSWIEWGFWQLPLHNKAQVNVTMPRDGEKDDITIQNEVVVNHSAVFDGDWQAIVVMGLQELQSKMTTTFRENRPSSPKTANSSGNQLLLN